MSNKITQALSAILRPRAAAKAASRPSIRMPSRSTMTTYRGGGTYNTGISEEAVEQKATEDGQTGTLDPSNVGKNSYPHAIDHIVEGHQTAADVIGHDLRDTVQSSDEVLNRQLEEVSKTEAEAMEAIDEHTSAQRQMLVQRQKMRAAGLPIPSRRNVLDQVMLLLLLFLGEWGLLALGFQIMGLSDRPWIPFLGASDDLHLAALSSVMGLLILGHIVGGRVRRIEHALEVRRQAGADRNDFPKPAIFDYLCSIVAFVTAVGGIIWLSSIRAEYLTAIGVDANFWSFVGVQFLILTAAIGITFAHANPEAEEWKAIDKSLVAATMKRDETVESHTTAVGSFNAIIDRRLTDTAKAGHHVNADAADARGQIAAYKRRHILAQLEPAQEELFKEHLTITLYKDGELLNRLTGVTPFPEFSKALTQKVTDALAAALDEISTLRAQIDQIEINKLNPPGVEELFASKKAAVAKTSEEETMHEPPISTTHIVEASHPAGREEADETTITTLRPAPAATSDDDSDDSVDNANDAEESA